VGAIVGLVFDVDEVSETSAAFAKWFALLALPLLFFTVVGIWVKVSRELRSLAEQGQRGFAAFAKAMDKHVRILTGRGISLAAASMIMVAMALAAKWAQLGVVAVAGLGALYIFSTLATVVSAFSVRAFDDRLRRGRGSIDREMCPTVVDAGDPVEERFLLARVPVPPAFRLHIEEELPDRLAGQTRFAVDRGVSRAKATLSAPLPRTARGVYKLGPAQIWYEDVLGMTRVAVATHACANLRVLPRLRAISWQKEPRSLSRAEGPLSRLSRLATEDHYRTRDYVHGDDLRRVHWKQSVNTGKLVVRVAESVPYAPQRVLLALDTHLPKTWAYGQSSLEDALDVAVETWIAIAHAFVRRGEKVEIVTAGPEGRVMLSCKRGEERRWRSIGADAAFQSTLDAHALMNDLSAKDASAIIVTCGFSDLTGFSGGKASVVLVDTANLLPAPPKSEDDRLFRYRYPVGAEDNKIDWKELFSSKPDPARVLRAAATARTDTLALAGRGVDVVLARPKGAHVALERP
jgi:uncharacterized protein (DUF58 family)